ncbi:helix-turn-helix transcriptional regulator [Gilvibacter sp.]|uniref:helix-turn-helix transcriptional regulator n=1 Tax=Gilvibacter sp. TaxID=2729997 RepID=UPI0025C243B3|nr:helix-turn-helix transcriptional regulator [Gilvibacter sp.]NQX77791.1 helix-turn-helix transcriptional regulator [Gilvibacter sp.]
MSAERVLFFIIFFGLFNALIVSIFFILSRRSPGFLKSVSGAVICLCLVFLQDFLIYFGHILKFRPEWFIYYIHLILFIPGLFVVAYNKKLQRTLKGTNYIFLLGLISYILLFLILSGVSIGQWLNLYGKVIEPGIAIIAIGILFRLRLIWNKNLILENKFVLAFGVILSISFLNKLCWGLTLAINRDFWFLNVRTFFLVNLVFASISAYLLSVMMINYFFKKKLKKVRVEEKSFLGIDESLINQIETQKLYCNKETSLEQLAASLNISSKQLSSAISNYKGVAFNEYINDLRLNHFVALLREGRQQELTILALAEESGFNSKTTFNRIFKKKFDCTPKEYISNLNSTEK